MNSTFAKHQHRALFIHKDGFLELLSIDAPWKGNVMQRYRKTDEKFDYVGTFKPEMRSIDWCPLVSAGPGLEHDDEHYSFVLKAPVRSRGYLVYREA